MADSLQYILKLPYQVQALSFLSPFSIADASYSTDKWDSTEQGQNRSDTKSCWYQELMKNGLNKGKVSGGRFDCVMVKC